MVSLDFFKGLENIRIGAAKKAEFVVLASPSDVKKAVADFIADKHFKDKHESKDIDGYTLSYQVGSWSPKAKVSGAQTVRVRISGQKKETCVSMESKSVMAQLVDWGANKKNLDELSSHLRKSFKEKVKA